MLSSVSGSRGGRELGAEVDGQFFFCISGCRNVCGAEVTVFWARLVGQPRAAPTIPY